MNSPNTKCLIPLKCLEIFYPSSTETHEHTKPSNISTQPAKKKTNKVIWIMGDPGKPVVFSRS